MHTPEFRFRLNERTPEHTTFTVFVGPEGQGSNAGQLTLTNEEYDVLAPLLLAAPKLLAALEELVDDIEGANAEKTWRLDNARAAIEAAS